MSNFLNKKWSVQMLKLWFDLCSMSVFAAVIRLLL